MTSNQAEWSWRISWRGKSWTDADLTGQHLATLALITGDDRFEDLSIDESEILAYPGLGHQRLMGMLGALVAVSTADDFDGDAAEIAAALAEISEASVDEILGAVEFSR